MMKYVATLLKDALAMAIGVFAGSAMVGSMFFPALGALDKAMSAALFFGGLVIGWRYFNHLWDSFCK